jgi:hypothetical protein
MEPAEASTPGWSACAWPLISICLLVLASVNSCTGNIRLQRIEAMQSEINQRLIERAVRP